MADLFFGRLDLIGKGQSRHHIDGAYAVAKISL
jgi:hypothetical protein